VDSRDPPVTQGGAALSPGLSCKCPFGAKRASALGCGHVIRNGYINLISAGEQVEARIRPEGTQTNQPTTDKLLELVEHLFAQIVSVHEKENSSGVSVFDEPVAEVDSGIRLAAAGCHLNQRTRLMDGERLFEALDAFDLSSPKITRMKRRHFSEPGPHRFIELGEVDPFVGSVESEDGAASSGGFERVHELRDLADGLVSEGKRQAVVRQASREAVDIFAGLRFDAGERVTLRFRFDHADGIGVMHGVGIARDEREFSNGHANSRRDVHLAVVLHDPASLFKLAVDLLPRFLFGCHGPLCSEVAGACRQ
jgi:hypothetical protein